MSFLNFSRGALRAPLKTTAIYEKNSSVRKAEVLNISETGLLLSRLRQADVGEELNLVIKLPQFPIFQNLSVKKIKDIIADSEISASILRVRGKIVRAYTVEGETEAGLQFDDLDLQTTQMISDYISLYSQNIIFILNLFEQIGDNEQCVEMIRLLSSCLGYNPGEKISVLRQKILHDYQNIESN